MPAPQPPSPNPSPATRPVFVDRNPFPVIVSFVTFVAVLAFARIAADLTQSYDVRLARLDAEVAALKVEVKKIAAPAVRTFAYRGYRFDLPLAWRADLNGSGAAFFDETGAQLALLSCPPPETGYEAWKFEEMKREMTDPAGRAHEFSLLLGAPDAELYGQDVKDLGDLNILSLSRKGERPEDGQASCLLISWSAAGASDEDFKRIYTSAGLE